MKPMNPAIWESAAEDVLALFLTEHYVTGGENFYNRAVYEMGLWAMHMPPGKWRELMGVVMQLHSEGKALNWNNITQIAPPCITEQWYSEVWTTADEKLEVDFDSNVKLLKQYGQRTDVIETLEDGIKRLREGDELDKVVDAVVSGTSSSDSQEISGETAGEGAARVRHLLSAAPAPCIPTGFDFIDEVTGGLRSQRLWILAGPYKSRKTTIGYNMILNAYRAGKSPAVMSLENTYDTMLMSFVAMLAIEWLLKQNKVQYAPDASVYWISADGLLQAGSGYKNWSPLKVQAIDYAIEEMERVGKGIRFYDTSPKYGGLSDFTSIRRAVRRDMRLHKGDVFLVDHQGLVDGQGEVYEDTRSVSKSFQRLSRIDQPHPITLIVLAQLNENAVKGEANYSAGVKGGGDTAANCDYLLTTTPVPLADATGDYCDDRTSVKVKFNRWGGTTRKHEVLFHPESGLKMPDKKINLAERTA